MRGCASKAKGPNGNRHGKPQPTVTSLLRPGLCERDAHPPAAGVLSALPRVSTKRSCVTQNIVHPRPPMVHICAGYTHTHTHHIRLFHRRAARRRNTKGEERCAARRDTTRPTKLRPSCWRPSDASEMQRTTPHGRALANMQLLLICPSGSNAALLTTMPECSGAAQVHSLYASAMIVPPLAMAAGAAPLCSRICLCSSLMAS